MSLSSGEVTTVLALVTREGITNFQSEVQAAVISAARAAALSTLSGVITSTVTVSDWSAIIAYVAGADSTAILQILGDLNAALTAHDVTNVGVLLIELYASAKKHFGM